MKNETTMAELAADFGDKYRLRYVPRRKQK